MGQDPGWLGEVWLDGPGIRLPALVGTALDAPENYRTLPLISNAVVPVNVIAGLQVPFLRIPLAVTANWFNPTVLNQFLGLPNRNEPIVLLPGGWYGFPRLAAISDLADLGSMTIWNGVTAVRMFGVKCGGLVLGLSQGVPVSAELQFMGAALAEVSWTRTVLPFVQAPARSQNCSHNLGARPTQWRLSLQNSLRANATLYPVSTFPFLQGADEINAGPFRASVAMTFQGNVAIPANFLSPVAFRFNVVPPGGVATAIEITNPLAQGLYSRTFTKPRHKVPFTILCRGNADATAPVRIYQPF